MLLLRLFYEFFKVGLFSVGGGLATLPFLQEMGARTGWFTTEQLYDMLAVSESTPGPIGVNMATYVGFTTAGAAGSVVATLGLVTPSVIVILIVALFLKNFKDNKYVKSAFYGLRPASMGLICTAAIGVVLITLFNIDLFRETGKIIDLFSFKAIILAVVLFALSNIFKKIHPVVWIGLAAVVGIVFGFAA
ncbi:MAG: chromate transporter [Ruminococcaceae bacterium]|nr:chromate transporter [Oscillospiraceae bacterium]